MKTKLDAVFPSPHEERVGGGSGKGVPKTVLAAHEMPLSPRVPRKEREQLLRRMAAVSRCAWLALFVALALATNLAAAESTAAPPARESIEWCDIWISHANETNLPRVLLIGDSITRDYYREVENRLEGKAFVARLATSRFAADPVLLKEVELVLNDARFDVIHFNNGMHGWQHDEAEYQKALPRLIKTIRAQAPKAKLIWASTTPLRDGKGVTYDTKAEYSDDRIASRNALAAEIMTEQKIPTVDLNAAVRGHPEFHSDNVHFNGQGSQILAAQVSEAVEKLLPR